MTNHLFPIDIIFALTCSVLFPTICVAESALYDHQVSFDCETNRTAFHNKAEDIIFSWKKYGRENIDGALYKVASYTKSTMPAISNKWSRNGSNSAECVSVKENNESTSKARCMFQLVGNKSEGVDRLLEIGETYWIGFSLKNNEKELKSNWELYFQLHDNTPAPLGWGPTINPQVAIERADDNYYSIVYRYNNLNNKTITRSQRLGLVNTTGYTDFLLQIRISNPEPNGILSVWQRNEKGNLINYIDLQNIRLGYYRRSKNNGPAVALGIYNGAPGVAGRTVFIDSLTITHDPVAIKRSVDPEYFDRKPSMED